MDGRSDSGQGNGIKSVRRAFKIIEMIRADAPIRSTVIAERIDCSQSTAHYYLKTLEECGYVIRQDGGFELGLKFLQLGGQAMVSRNLYCAMNLEVAELAVDVGESVQVAIEENGVGYYVEHVSGNSAAESTRQVGTMMSLHSTAAGKAILSELPSDRLDEIIGEHGLMDVTENTISTRSMLDDELQRIRETSIAFETREYSDDESGIAIPLKHENELIGALELTLPPTRIPDPRRSAKGDRFPDELVSRIRESARTIENRFTHLS